MNGILFTELVLVIVLSYKMPGVYKMNISIWTCQYHEGITLIKPKLVQGVGECWWFRE